MVNGAATFLLPSLLGMRPFLLISGVVRVPRKKRPGVYADSQRAVNCLWVLLQLHVADIRELARGPDDQPAEPRGAGGHAAEDCLVRPLPRQETLAVQQVCTCGALCDSTPLCARCTRPLIRTNSIAHVIDGSIFGHHSESMSETTSPRNSTTRMRPRIAPPVWSFRLF
jgi:hypothetical protein